MIDLNKYQLTHHELGKLSCLRLWTASRSSIIVGFDDELGLILVVQAPARQHADEYRYPVWALNGIFIEQDEESGSHRWLSADALSALNRCYS